MPTETRFLESERLYLREITEADFPLYFHLETDPVVMKYIGPPRNEQEARQRMQCCLDQYADDQSAGLGKWMAVEKETGDVIGWFALTPLDGTGLIETGYRLREESWGRGYATEMSRAIIDYGFRTKNLDQIVAVTLEENIASQKVLTKVGLRFIRNDRFYEKDVMFFELKRSDYRASD